LHTRAQGALIGANGRVAALHDILTQLLSYPRPLRHLLGLMLARSTPATTLAPPTRTRWPAAGPNLPLTPPRRCQRRRTPAPGAGSRARPHPAGTVAAAFMNQQSASSLPSCTGALSAALLSFNVAVGESARALGRAFSHPGSRARVARHPGRTVAAPHIFKMVAVPGICVA
jgi:hypothetical protein